MTETTTPSITMYGADWCGDCRRAKAWFEDNGFAYDYIDLVEHPDETQKVLDRNNGKQKIPMIVFADDSHLVEPTNDDLAAKMQELAGAAAPDATAAPAASVAENIAANRFELHRNGEVVSFASYRTSESAPTNVVVPHVETDPQHRGNGYAAELMDGMLALLRSSERTITPLCPFAAGHIRDNPQHQDLLSS